MKHIVLFASGSGSNAEKIADYFANNTDVKVSLIVSNNPKAGVIERARRLHIPVLLFDRTTFYTTSQITELLLNQEVDPDRSGWFYVADACRSGAGFS